MSARRFAELFDSVDHAATIDELAGHLIDHLPELVAAPVVGLLLFDELGCIQSVEFGGPDNGLDNRYVERGMQHDELLAQVMSMGAPMHDLMLRSDAEWRQHPMYLEFGRRENLRHYGGTPLVVGGVARGAIGCSRWDGDKPLTTEQLLDLATVSLRAQDRLTQLDSHRPRSAFQRLTQRQLEVCEHVARGGSNEVIAKATGISINGVKAHLKNIYVLVGVESRDRLTEEFLFWYPTGRSALTERI